MAEPERQGCPRPGVGEIKCSVQCFGVRHKKPRYWTPNLAHWLSHGHPKHCCPFSRAVAAGAVAVEQGLPLRKTSAGVPGGALAAARGNAGRPGGAGYEAFQQKPTDLERHIYLRALQDTNETLYYRLILDHLAEMVPIVYTPTVGLACQKFSHIFRRPPACSWPIRSATCWKAPWPTPPPPTSRSSSSPTASAILGLGDQGANGMGIPIGKLSLYAACAGIHPAATLPVLLDAGTDNEDNLRDPLYVGWRHPQCAGPSTTPSSSSFVQGVVRTFPGVLLQWRTSPRPTPRACSSVLPGPAVQLQRRHPGHRGGRPRHAAGRCSLSKGRLREQRIAVVARLGRLRHQRATGAPCGTTASPISSAATCS